MINFVDTLLNRITMYRLALYYLIFLVAVAILFSFTGVLPYDPYALLFSVGFLIAACWITNTIFARTFGVPPNAESIYISALILALIITPVQATPDLWFLGWAAVWAMASKYIFAIKGKHIFNPVAFAVALTYLAINQSASWWVGNAPMLPFVLIGGLLVVRKLGRFQLVGSFLLAALVTVVVFSVINRENVITALQKTAVYSPLVFFAALILTEPLSMPATRRFRLIYGALVGVLVVPQFHVGSLYSTPELAILIGNVFSFIVSPKTTLVLKLKEKIQLAPDIYDFIFVPNRKLAFVPGQYMEWTLGHDEPDTRGNRRYFTLASSPTEDQLRLGVKFYRKSSTFKQALLGMDANHEIVAQQIAGDFVLPNDPQQKCVFLAGGIGITPFRSMIKYLLDTQQRRPITLFYANRNVNEILYQDVFDRANRALGIRTVYTLTDPNLVPAGWRGKVGHITPEMIKEAVPDYQNCVFYISGPKGMVDGFHAVLRGMQIKGSHIKTDYFAGLAQLQGQREGGWMTMVLIIDDDKRLTEPVQYQLETLGYRVVVAHDGPTGLRLAFSEKPDVIVLDIMLPGMDGWQLCQEIRRFSQIPIIMLTALGMEVDRIRGLELGADDYLTKPFSFQELAAHIKSILRRVQWDQSLLPDSQVQIGGVTLNLVAHRAFKDGVELTLRNKEYELLSLLMQQAGKALTREVLFNQIWGTDWLGDTRSLDVHVRWLRQKIEDDPSLPQYIQTVRNVGYRFATAEEVHG